MAAQQTHTGWTFNDCGAPEYLDGIQSQFDVRNATGSPVAYAFREDECRLISAAPELLEALMSAYGSLVDYIYAAGQIDDDDAAMLDQIRAAITKATGAGQ